MLLRLIGVLAEALIKRNYEITIFHVSYNLIRTGGCIALLADKEFRSLWCCVWTKCSRLAAVFGCKLEN